MPREITTKQRVWQKGRGFAWLTKCCFGLLISAPLIPFTCHLLKNSMQQGFVVGNNHFLHRMIYQSEWHFSWILFCIYFIVDYNLKSKQHKIQKELIYSQRRQAVTEPHYSYRRCREERKANRKGGCSLASLETTCCYPQPMKKPATTSLAV